jgi:hypothetical protein
MLQNRYLSTASFTFRFFYFEFLQPSHVNPNDMAFMGEAKQRFYLKCASYTGLAVVRALITARGTAN